MNIDEMMELKELQELESESDDYECFDEAIQHYSNLHEIAEKALYDALDLATTIQECYKVKNLAGDNDRLCQQAYAKADMVGNKQLLSCNTIPEILELVRVANSIVLKTAGLFKATQIASDFKDYKLISQENLCNQEIESIVWNEMLKAAKTYDDCDYVVKKANHLLPILSEAIDKRSAILNSALENAKSSLDKLAILYDNPNFKNAAYEIADEFNDIFAFRAENINSFNEAKYLHDLIVEFKRPLIKNAVYRKKVIRAMFEFAKTYDEAKYTYKCAPLLSKLRIAALTKMSTLARTAEQIIEIESAPEFNEIATSRATRTMSLLKYKLTKSI